MALSILCGCTGTSKPSFFAYVIISKSHELASIFVDFIINMLYITITDSSAYAHYVFNTFDHDRNGSISFEVTIIVLLVSLSLCSPGDITYGNPSFGHSRKPC